MSGLVTMAVRGQTELAAQWKLDVGDYAIDATISHEGALGAVGTGAGDVLVFDLETGRQRWRIGAHPGGVTALGFSPRKSILATAGRDGCVRFFDIDGSPCAELPGKGGWIEQLAWSHDGSLLAVSSSRTLRLWSSAGEPRLETDRHPSTVTGVAWSKDGSQIATCCYGGVHLWQVRTGGRARHLPWKGSLISMAWSPDHKVIACGSQDACVHFWRVTSGKDSQMSGYPFKPKALAWNASSTMLATAGDAKVTVWRFLGKGPEGKAPLELAGHRALCTALAFAPKTGLLASGAADTGVLVWEPSRTCKPLRYTFLEDEITKVVWHPSGNALLAADASGHLSYFRVG